MKTILRILETWEGIAATCMRVENPPYLPLVIEATPDPGPCGLRAISVAHYSEQNGDLMRDPEMCFELSSPLGLRLTLTPYYWRHDYMGVEQYSRTNDGKHYAFSHAHYAKHESFARLWDKNLYVQGFLAAYERRHTQG